MNLEPDVDQIGGEVFGNLFGEGGNEGAFVAFGALANFFDQIVDLVFQGSDFYGGVYDASGTNDLLDGCTALFEFISTGGGG